MAMLNPRSKEELEAHWDSYFPPIKPSIRIAKHSGSWSVSVTGKPPIDRIIKAVQFVRRKNGEWDWKRV